jgi:hypothetical protein
MADPTAYDELINRYADEYDIDPQIFRRLINQESRFNPQAVSPKGATGIGQVMPATARDPGYGVRPLAAEDLTNAEENLRFSAEYLGAMLREFGGDYPMALAAYNAGPGAVKKYEGIPPFEETQNYVQTILGSEELLRTSGQVRPQARPEPVAEDQAENNSYLDSLSEALPYLEAAQLTGAPQARFDPPGVRRPQRRSGDDALKRLGIASLVQ